MSYQMRTLANAMEKLQEKGMQAGPRQRLLKKLHFTSISTRERKVTTAHADTFKWLVSPNEQTNQLSSCLDFIAWLNGGNGVFWTHGKPGSGKSTFMKFICAQNSVRDHLEHWAKDHQLVTPSFYFWYAGSRLRRSLEGLLRTLLYEILRRMPEVIPINISDPGLTVPVSYDEDWDLETLFHIYELVIQQPGKVNFCFFIDGLDEFHDEEHRSIWDLTSALHRLQCSDKIKFGKFNSHEQFARLREIDSSYEGLISEVVDRAQGVFLWVRLVVQSLLEGFTFHDSARTLRQRLQSFPDDLSEFFLTTLPPLFQQRIEVWLRTS
ncbi:hypothetical protein PG993_011591 [Apiospora rasikravindrae]|uniref:Nephrocystin 3-like N-terminal domain-containing protein n=1 Tax=Apiospora rasikravindrae TaxID=990691 RepID=A0ABR1S1H3_9PEZI